MANEPAPVESRSQLSFGIGRLFGLVSDAVIVASAATGRVVLWNRAASALFGVEERDAVDMPLYELVPEGLRDRHIEGLARYARGEPSTIIDSGDAVELPALRADGSPLWIELRLSSVPAEDEAASDDGRHVIAIIRDITARKAAEAEAVAKADQLRSINETLRDFLAAVAHDIVGPAGGISGAAALLVDTDNAGEVADTARMIASQADLIVELGRDLGQLAVIQRGSVPTRPADASVAEAVHTAIESTAHMSSATVHVAIPPGLEVHADPIHLTRIVANLIGNARKYGHPPIEVAAKASDDGVEVRVSDRGPGIPTAFASQLFDQFTRAVSGGVGLGLGLAIAKGLAVANGGDVWYEANEPTGATFAVRLPRTHMTSAS